MVNPIVPAGPFEYAKLILPFLTLPFESVQPVPKSIRTVPAS